MENRWGAREALIQAKLACQQVLCVAQRIWRSSKGLIILYINIKHGYNTSPFSDFNLTNKLDWSEVDLENLLLALRAYPVGTLSAYNFGSLHTDFLTLDKTQGDNFFGVFPDGLPVTTFYAGRDVYFFQDWQQQSKARKIYLAFQAFAHQLGNSSAFKDGLAESQAWLDLSGWEKENGRYHFTDDQSKFVSTHALNHPFEDFVESVATYRFDPEQLYSIHPGKFNFIKEKVFKGKEF